MKRLRKLKTRKMYTLDDILEKLPKTKVLKDYAKKTPEASPAPLTAVLPELSKNKKSQELNENT